MFAIYGVKINIADIMTKSLPEGVHKIHADRLRNGQADQSWREDVGYVGHVGDDRQDENRIQRLTDVSNVVRSNGNDHQSPTVII
jgi:hypothetical protein